MAGAAAVTLVVGSARRSGRGRRETWRAVAIALRLIGSSPARRIEQIDVKLIDLNVLLRQPLSQRRQIIDQCVAGLRRLGLGMGREDAILYRNLEPHRTQFGGAQPQPHRSSAGTDRLERSGHALHEPNAVDSAGDRIAVAAAGRRASRRIARRPDCRLPRVGVALTVVG